MKKKDINRTIIKIGPKKDIMARKRSKKRSKARKSSRVAKKYHASLHLKSFALAAGVTWAIGLLFIALGFSIFGWAPHIMEFLQGAYIGYDATPLGILIGMTWGFLDIAIGCAIFVWLYNWFLDKEK
jgi:hypothetical protein